jgi:glycosyltransferase involved in cell wall biosynthesis
VSAPLVSILTPCLDSGRFLAACLASVQAQDYPHIEHVIQDGGSTDGSIELLRDAPKNVAWVSKPDGGQSDALDQALRRSQGDILLVLNADDELLPGAARWGVEQMQRHPAQAVVYGDLYLIDEDSVIIGECHGPPYDFASIFCVEQVIPAQAAFIRRSALEAVGLRVDVSLDTCPDYEMFVRLGLRYSMRHVPGFVARYRYYRRPLDGRAPRSVERFVRAKSSVMARVRHDPDASASTRGLDRRARAGLALWASEEARAQGDSRRAWLYYADALADFGVAGIVLARFLRVWLRFTAMRQPKPYPTRPNVRRALGVGKSLLWERRGTLVVRRSVAGVRRALVACSRGAFLLVPLVSLLVLLYVFVVILSHR